MPPVLTTFQKLLVALAELKRDPVPHGDLVLAAWKKFPEAFGLRGHEEASASDNAVSAAIYGKRGVMAKGWAESTGDRAYRLTDGGRAELAEIKVAKCAPGRQRVGTAAANAARRRRDGNWYARFDRKAPTTFATVDRLERGEHVTPDELAVLAMVHRTLGERFLRHMGRACV